MNTNNYLKELKMSHVSNQTPIDVVIADKDRLINYIMSNFNNIIATEFGNNNEYINNALIENFKKQLDNAIVQSKDCNILHDQLLPSKYYFIIILLFELIMNYYLHILKLLT